MTYKVKLVSQTNAIVLIITGLVAFLGSVGILLPPNGLQSTGLSILVVSIVAVVVYFLWQFFVTGRTVWTIDNNGIKIVWTKQFFLARNADVTIKWSDIADIKRGADPQYYNLKIKLVSGDTIRYFHDTLTTRDDFEDMLKTLYLIFGKRAAANKSMSDKQP